MSTITDELSPLFFPESVAIVGASGDYSKFTGRTVKYLLKHGFTGRFYPVNPKRDDIAGHRCYPSVSDLPEPVDTAFIQVSAKFVPQILEECIAKGVRSVIIHSSGMGEDGESGKKRQAGLRELSRKSGMRVVGPNCAGIVNTHRPVVLSPIVCYELNRLPLGRIGLISQSGGLTGAYVARAEARGIGFSYVISTGNEMDLEACDYIEYLLHDERTDVVAVFLESVRDGNRFRQVTDMALEANKPIIVLKIGRTSVGARAAASHTGALTGSDAVYDAVFRQDGVIRVETMEDLFETASLFCKTRPPNGKRVGVVTTTGGGATILVEAGARCGLDFPLPSDDAVAAASEFLPSFAATSNPMDVTMAGAGGGYKKGLQVMLNDPAFDMVVGVVGTSSQFAPELGVKPLMEVHPSAEKPLVAFCNPNAEEALRLFERNGIASFRTPEACGRALANLIRYGEFLDRRKDTPASTVSGPSIPGLPAHVLKKLNASGGILNEYESKKILSAYGVSTPREEVAIDLDSAMKAARRVGYPLAVKVMSEDIPHKTEAGIIRLDIHTDDQLNDAYSEILQNAKAYHGGARIDGVLVSRMQGQGLEVIVGMTNDALFGPTLMFGMGGIFVEVYKDISHRVLPVCRRDVEDMILEIKGAVLLKGFRGMKKPDVDAIVSTLLKVDRLAAGSGGRIRELDINPLIVYETGAVAVDALIRTS